MARRALAAAALDLPELAVPEPLARPVWVACTIRPRDPRATLVHVARSFPPLHRRPDVFELYRRIILYLYEA